MRHYAEDDSVIHLCRWTDMESAAGLQAYIISKKFQPKLIQHVVGAVQA